MKPLGLIIIIASIFPPLILFWQYGAEVEFSVLFSQYLGMISLIYMGIVQVMATRIKGIEAVFGPLDQIYVLHKWLAVIAIAAAFLHESIDTETLSSVAAQPVESEDGLAETFGEIGYYGILILGLGSLATFIPYNIWRWTHRFIGVFFALAALHFLMLQDPFVWIDPLGLYITAFCAAGFASFIYLTLKGILGRTKSYSVEKVEVFGRVTSITMKPENKPISFKAGQFSFISFDQDGLQETHPYTIASAPQEDGRVRFCISALGDYTSRIHEVQVGSKARLSKGYGGFRKFADNQDQIWIAGGVGITPFLAWTQTLTGEETGNVYLYYGVRNRLENPFEEELKALANRLPNLKIQILESDLGELIDARLLKVLQGVYFDMMPIAFCGPQAMREGLMEGLKAEGYPIRQFHYEQFEMRSGIGIMRLIKYIARRFEGWLLRPASAS